MKLACDRSSDKRIGRRHDGAERALLLMLPDQLSGGRMDLWPDDVSHKFFAPGQQLRPRMLSQGRKLKV